MKELTETSGKKLNSEERNLLSVAYKNVVGARRSSWRVISARKDNLKGDNPVNLEIIKDYLATIEQELEEKCDEIIVSFCML